MNKIGDSLRLFLMLAAVEVAVCRRIPCENIASGGTIVPMSIYVDERGNAELCDCVLFSSAVGIIFDTEAHLTISNVTALECTFSVSIQMSLNGLSINVVNTTMTGSFKHFSVSTSTLANFTMRVSNSRLTLMGSVVVFAADVFENVALAIENSTLHGHNSNGVARVAAFVGRSTPSVQVTNLSMTVIDSELIASGASESVAVGFASSSAGSLSVFASSVLLSVIRSTVTAISVGRGAASVGISSYCESQICFSRVTVSNVTIVARESTIFALARKSAAAMAFTSYVYDLASNVNVTNFTASCFQCNVTAESEGAVSASLGIASLGRTAKSSTAGIYLRCEKSNVTSRALGYSAASLGIASHGIVHSDVDVDSIVMVSDNCVVTASCDGFSASCLGISSVGNGAESHVNVAALQSVATNSFITANATRAGATSMGIAAYGKLFSTVRLDEAQMTSRGCHVTAIVSEDKSVSSLGVSSFARGPGSTVDIDVANFVVTICESVVSAVAEDCVACVGVVAIANDSPASSVIIVTNFIVHAWNCVVTATSKGRCALCFGASSLAASSKSTVAVIARRISISANDCVVESRAHTWAGSAFALSAVSHNASLVDAADVVINGHLCTVVAETSLYHATCSFGVCVYATRFPEVELNTVTFAASQSNITSIAQGNTAAVLGIAVYSGKHSTVVVNNCHLSCLDCQALSMGIKSNSVTALGMSLATFSVATHVTISNFTVYGMRSNVSSLANYNAASSFGVALYGSEQADLIVWATNVTIIGENCSIFVSHKSLAAVAFGIVAHAGSTDLHITQITAGVVKSNVAMSNGYCNVGLGMFSSCDPNGHAKLTAENVTLCLLSSLIDLPQWNGMVGSVTSSQGALQNVSASQIALYMCNSVCQGKTVVAVAAEDLAVSAQWVLRNLTLVASMCIIVHPIAEGPNLMEDLALSCGNPGWSKTDVPASHARNISVNGLPCDIDCLSGNFPGVSSNISEGLFGHPCNYFYSLPVVHIPAASQSPAAFCPRSNEPATASYTISQSDSQTASFTASFTQTSATRSLSAAQRLSSSTQSSSNVRSASQSIVPSVTLPSVAETTMSRTTARTVSSTPPGTTTAAPTQNVANVTRKPSSNPVAVMMSVDIPPEAAEAVATVGPVSTVGAGLATPTAASQYARVASVLRAVMCILSEEEDTPSYVEHPIQMAVGSGSLPKYSGACLCDVLLLLLVQLLQLGLVCGAKRILAMRRFVKFGGIVSAILSAYFLPNCVGAASVLIFAGRGDSVQVFVAVFALIGWFCLLAFPLWMTLRLGCYVKWRVDTAGDKVEVHYEPHDESSLFVERFSKFFDDSRDPGNLACRFLYFEEVISCSVSAFLSGLRPPSDKCSVVLISILSISTLHFLFLITLRPYNRRIANIFSILSAAVVVTICVLGIFVLRDTSKQTYLTYPLLLQNSIFFLQAAVEGVWAYVRFSKRSVVRRQAEAARALLGDDDDSDGAIPMTKQSNPLELKEAT